MSSLSKFPKNHEKRGEEKEDDGFGEKVANGWNRFISDPLPPWNETGRNEKVWKRRVASLPRAHLAGPREITRGKYFGRRSTGEGENREERGGGTTEPAQRLNEII